MKKAILYLLLGTAVSFLFHYFLSGFGKVSLDLYYAFAFGLGWGMAYFLDRPDFALPKKLGLSFIGIILLVVLGIVFLIWKLLFLLLFVFQQSLLPIIFWPVSDKVSH